MLSEPKFLQQRKVSRLGSLDRGVQVEFRHPFPQFGFQCKFTLGMPKGDLEGVFCLAFLRLFPNH